MPQLPDRTDHPNDYPAIGACADDSEWLSVIHAHNLRGAYADAAAYADSLTAAVRAHPRVSLACTRTRMRQGRMADASAALAAADRAAASAGEQLILALEEAALRIYREVAVGAALAAADTAFVAAAGTNVATADQAEAERVHVRILLTAAVYHEISAEEGRCARARLPALAETLEQVGRIDESLAARLTYAERLEEPGDRLGALTAIANRAREAGRPGLAGEAVIGRAEQLLAIGASTDAIRTELDAADALFTAAHIHGPIDVRRVRARLAVERDFVATDALVGCLEAYRQIDYPRGALSLLLDLSQLAHVRGDLATAAAYRRQTLEMAEATGMGLARDSAWMAQIDLLMRAADFGGAIELCQAALAAEPPAFATASYEQLLATAYAFVHDHDSAHEHMQRALAGYESIGAIDSASNAALKFASDLDSTRQDSKWDEAAELLRRWLDRDESRGDIGAALMKRELLAQIDVNRYYYSPTRRKDPALLAAAAQTLATAEQSGEHLSGRERAQRLGAVHQLRGQLAQTQGDAAVERAWRDALAVYESAGLAMEAANCRHIIGALRLNLANQDFRAHFAEAETNMRQALDYYTRAGMRERAADTRFMFARLYANAAPRVPPHLGEQMLDAALGHLADGEADYDAVRREFAVGPVLAAQIAKRTFAERSRRIYDLALEILVSRNDPAEAWRWCQRAKARALGDALGASAALPARVLAELEVHPESFARVTRERELTVRCQQAASSERLMLRTELAALRERMAHDPYLEEYLALRNGTAIECDDLEAVLGPTAAPGSCVCIDWAEAGNQLVMIALRPGEVPQMVSLGLTLSAVRAFVVSNLGPDKFRQTLRDVPELLRELEPLIAPLAGFSQPGELLVLSPTGPLHALPLHALTLEGQPLLKRNPVVYCPSLSVLRHCLARRHPAGGRRTAALFGDPNGDRGEAAELVSYLGQRFHTRPKTRAEVTWTAFAEGVAGCDFVHFQGHARYHPDDPLKSCLLLAGKEPFDRFTAADVFALRDLRAELVALGACESAASVIKTGDEPLGLIPAFLFAGAGAVLAALWPVHRAPAAQAMSHFYDILATETVDKARALREALLKVKDTPGFDTPYHWAPFALYGDWR